MTSFAMLLDTLIHDSLLQVLSFLASVLFLVDAMLNLLWWRGAKDEINVCPCSPWQADLV